MTTFPIPRNEGDRVAAVRSLGLLDTPCEERFDRLTRLARRMFDIPIALITLVDANRQWFKSRQGVPFDETPRDHSFCTYAILGETPLVIHDAASDVDFATHPAVTGDFGIRFYAGVPLRSADGHPVGTLCVLDTRARRFDTADLAVLEDLAAVAQQELAVSDLRLLLAERDAARDALAASHLMLSEAQQVAHMGSYEMDVASGRLAWSAELYRIFGREPADFSPSFEAYLACVVPEDRAAAATSLERLASGDGHLTEAVGIVRPDGTERVVHVEKKLVRDEAGRPSRVIGTCQDVTDRQATERALQEARDDALEASRLKSEFLSTMSHEIRTPLSGVIGMTELLLDTALAADQREFATVVLESAMSLLGIINDILDFSKIEAGKLAVETIAFEPAVVAEGAAELIAAKARQKHLSVMLDLDPAIPRVLMGDPGRLRQVLLNVLSNAVKFTHHGEILLRVTLESEDDETVNLCFAVRDSGIGLSGDQRDRLFEPFVQADGSTTREFGGTGLGLSICKRLVNLMSGEIGFESQLGRGSNFWFTLPLGRDAAAADTPRLADLGALRVLVADPNPLARGILRRQLAHWGAHVAIASSRTELLARVAEARARRAPFDAILVDQQLGADRLALDHAAVGLPGGMGPRLILLADIGRKPLPEAQGRVPFAAVILKPVRQTSLLESLLSPISQAPVEEPADDLVLSVVALDGPSVLVVEDSAINRQVVANVLARQGCHVDQASNGREALARLAERPYDLVMMDCQMPVMDGFEATRALRTLELGRGRRTPVVALTANAMSGDRDRCLEAGMDDYLAKPFGQAQIRAILSRWLVPARAGASPAGRQDVREA